MDDRPFWFHPDASSEALVAHDRYAAASISAGESFQFELENARLSIARNPEMWASYLALWQRAMALVRRLEIQSHSLRLSR